MKVYSVDKGATSAWNQTTFSDLGHSETYLESIIANDPKVLGLDPFVTGLGTDFIAIRQASLEAPTGRNLRPDVVVLTGTGHLLIVEVKLSTNQELKDRRVIAQVVDYAAAVASLTESDLLSWLGAEPGQSWPKYVAAQFPHVHEPELLARALSDRIARADIHIAVVCDRAPDGLLETMRLISSQSALGEFQIHLVELTPFSDADGHVLMIPSEVARTEIVTRTSVTVRLGDGQRVELDVAVSSPEETAKAVKASKAVTRPEFQAVVDAYNMIAPDTLRTVGRTVAYRIINVPDWPWCVHYEFLDKAGGPDTVGIDIHVEAKEFDGVSSALSGLSSTLAHRFPGIEWIPKSSGRGQLRVLCAIGDPAEAADVMVDFIGSTRDTVQRAMDEAAVS